MIFLKKYSTFLVLFLFSANVFSQFDGTCGTDVTEADLVIIKEIAEKARQKNYKSLNDITIVPLNFHIIAYSSGIAGIDSAKVFDELAIVNSYYKDAGIEFQHCGYIDYINDNNYANFEKNTDETLCDANDVENVLNIYFAPDLYKVSGSSTIGLCGYAYSSSTTKNRILMQNSCSTNGSTLLHEIGHYFSLLHTHSTSNGEELVNGSNCGGSGDLLCDTPADPELSYSTISTSCVYTGNEIDANGDNYDPDVTNFMSYSRKECRNYFSPEQLNQINYYLNNYRDYLECKAGYFTNITNLDVEKYHNVYPNPANEYVVFESNKNISGHLIIFNVLGSSVFEGLITENAFHLNIADWNKGIYYYQVAYDNNESFSGKLLVE